jgi:site-specific DNA-methyltransferase (adenine-specific)
LLSNVAPLRRACRMAAVSTVESKPALNGHRPKRAAAPRPTHSLESPDARIFIGDCRQILASLPEVQGRALDLVFADPPFNWNRAYDQWDDAMPREDYLQFTRDWLDLCIRGLRPWGSLWVNIPDDTAAEIVVHLKQRGLEMVNWCVWHYRFGQNTTSRFINSKVHALYFVRPPDGGERDAHTERTWNPEEILEISDRRSIYFDARTENKRDGMPAGHRVPMDVWYGPFWGRIQGNNKERRHNHDNQLPESYLERVVLCSSNEGDLVLDPFLGSGTTGVVAHALKRRFIGCEFSPQNARHAFERMKAGPVRKLGDAVGMSTAIHPSRRRSKNAPAAKRRSK